MTDAYVILAGKLGYPESDSLGRLLRTLMDEEEAERWQFVFPVLWLSLPRSWANKKTR